MGELRKVYGFFAVKQFRECEPGDQVRVKWPMSAGSWGLKTATVVSSEKRSLLVRLDSGGEVRFTRCSDVLRYRPRFDREEPSQ